MTKTKIEIIDETVEYYKTHPRSTEGQFCRYINNNGDMCAIGRIMIDPLSAHKYESEPCIDLIRKLTEDDEFSLYDVIPKGILKPEYDGHESHFWSEIQTLHDSQFYWVESEEDNALTNYGESHVKALKQRYK